VFIILIHQEEGKDICLQNTLQLKCYTSVFPVSIINEIFLGQSVAVDSFPVVLLKIYQ